MRLADLATAWLRDDTHETLVSTMPYWEHCPRLGGVWEVGWDLRQHAVETLLKACLRHA